MLLCGAATAAHIQQPNVIVILTDDQGYQDLGCYGSALISTPQLDSMAAEGIRFTDFYVSSSVCSASRASLLTGRKPIHHGVRGVYGPGIPGMNNSEVTVASMLKTGGYRTAMFGKWHLGDQNASDMPTAFGFDEYFGIPYSNDMDIHSRQTFATNCVFLEGYTLAQAINDQNNGGVKNKVPLMEGTQIVEYPAAQATLTQRYFDRAIATINSATATNTNNPFFIYIAPSMPHIPLYASTNFAGTSARGTYGDVVEEIDHHVGRLLNHLKTNGLAQRTMVIFTSDNGPWLSHGTNAGSAAPLSGGKFSVSEGGVRVPCVMWWPGMWPSNQVSSQTVSSVDILPTIAHYAGTALPSKYLAGFNVSHHLENTAVPTGKPYDAVTLNNLFALRKGSWKIMPTGPTSETGSPELYNLVITHKFFGLELDF